MIHSNYDQMVIDHLRDTVEARNHECFDIVGMSWKDADLEDGCEGIEELTYDSKKGLLHVKCSSHATFPGPHDVWFDGEGWTKEEYEQRAELYGKVAEDLFISSNQFDGYWSGNSWDYGDHHYFSVPATGDVKKDGGRIISQADQLLKPFREWVNRTRRLCCMITCGVMPTTWSQDLTRGGTKS